MVSVFEPSDTGTCLFHDANALVAKNAAGRAGRHVPFEYVQVGASDRGLCNPHDRVGRGN